ncbi:MAG TPA: hypothetical protein VI032_18330 [Burkholderiaceae bacterium]
MNAGVKSDNGFAKQIPVLLQAQVPIWLQRMLGVLLVGAVSVLYLLWQLAVWGFAKPRLSWIIPLRRR